MELRGHTAFAIPFIPDLKKSGTPVYKRAATKRLYSIYPNAGKEEHTFQSCRARAFAAFLWQSSA